MEKEFDKLTAEEKEIQFQKWVKIQEGSAPYEKMFLEDFRKRFSVAVEGQELEETQISLLTDFASDVITEYQKWQDSVDEGTIMDSVIANWKKGE